MNSKDHRQVAKDAKKCLSAARPNEERFSALLDEALGTSISPA